MTVETFSDWTVFRLNGPALDATNFRDVEALLRETSSRSTKLAVDWSSVIYVDMLGIEAVLDVLADHPSAAAFVGANRNVRHLLHRMQLLPVLPIYDTVDSLRESA